MKLSEAIRLGAMMNPQGFDEMKADDGSTCALGAACEAVGISTENGQVFDAFPLINWAVADYACPTPDDSCLQVKGPVDCLVVHLNDRHRWTRERIADWVESVERSHEPQPAPNAVGLSSQEARVRQRADVSSFVVG